MEKGDLIPNGAIVVVADFSKALILINAATGQSPKLIMLKHLEADPNPAAHEQGADAPGRVVWGTHKSAVEITNYHEVEGRRFIGEVARHVHGIAAKEGADRLVLVAPPRSLAALREELAATEDSARIVMTVSKDLVNFPVDEIVRKLTS
ncbi:host attachment protein [Martelella endophytica]|uniref:Host attachment protein n=1 Tax=Martelella endophytica TaxID=1486262 RepID=A0A0D5LNL4_MAREN|nr:host attachment protein [Martelella endophytica]AJY45530.1 hypothetical protein TM49_07235 [Martelella endophytica]